MNKTKRIIQNVTYFESKFMIRFKVCSPHDTTSRYEPKLSYVHQIKKCKYAIALKKCLSLTCVLHVKINSFSRFFTLRLFCMNIFCCLVINLFFKMYNYVLIFFVRPIAVTLNNKHQIIIFRILITSGQNSSERTKCMTEPIKI